MASPEGRHMNSPGRELAPGYASFAAPGLISPGFAIFISDGSSNHLVESCRTKSTAALARLFIHLPFSRMSKTFQR